MKKRKFLTLLGVSTLAVGFWISSIIPSQADAQSGITNQPGSINDPVVTKSYVDQKVEQLVNQQIKQTSQQLISQLKAMSGNGSKLIVIELKPKQILYGTTGTEMVVRTGHVIAVSDSSNGIPDLTGGKDIKPGTSVGLNHLLLFPKDGRGIKPNIHYKGAIYVMIKGNYSIFENGKKVSP